MKPRKAVCVDSGVALSGIARMSAVARWFLGRDTGKLPPDFGVKAKCKCDGHMPGGKAMGRVAQIENWRKALPDTTNARANL